MNREPYQEVLALFLGQKINLLVKPRSCWFLQENPGHILHIISAYLEEETCELLNPLKINVAQSNCNIL